MSATHLIVGAGSTGSETARLLASMGNLVTIVTRSGSGPDEPGITRIASDAADSEQLARLAVGTSVIYNCANPPYHRWTTDWPPLAASLLQAAQANDAVLVTLSNLYMYAKPTSPMRATEPLDAPSVKGGVRAQMWHDASAAHDTGQVRVTEARASDFIGPDLGTNGHMGDRVVPRVLEGKKVSLLGDVDAIHSWTAINDVARTLVALGSDERAWGRAWHVPTAAPLSQRALVHEMCALAGVDPVKVSSVPNVIIRALGLAVPAMREMREVAYQFQAPFVIDSQETTDVFGIEPTALRDTLQTTLASYGHRRGSDIHIPS
jgi:nucleoside-diphosphate-sugar epimerase